jgi:hypothetical protein
VGTLQVSDLQYTGPALVLVFILFYSCFFLQDASFIQRAGNAGQGVSFESTNYPGRFIRHAGYLLWVHQKDGSDLFNKDSSFVPQRK